MVAVPAATPPIMPLALPMVAIAVLLLLQVPPLTVLVRVLVVPGQIVVVPVMVPASGAACTSIDTVALVAPQALLTL